MTIRGVFLDFGFVIGYPPVGIDRKYFYMDWAGIDRMIKDPELTQHLRPGVGRRELEAFFHREIYSVFVDHEQTDAVDPQSNQLLLDQLHLVFGCPIHQKFVDQLLTHLDTMKYITIDAQAVEVVADLKRQGLHLALISNMMLPGKLLTAKLREAKALAYFDQIAISSEVGFLKPHPEIFRQAVTRSRLRADEVLFVGDSYTQDILGAKRAGLQTAWLNPRHEPCPTTGDNQADYEIETLAELTEKPIVGR